MPASGLWKLVELELNTSFLYYLRIVKNICNKDSQTISLFEKDESFKIGWVELNESIKNGTELKTLMLGQLKSLSRNYNIKKIFDNAFISNDLYNLLESLNTIRNEHAHIKAMSLEKFEELNNLLFNEDAGSSTIEKLLEFKQKIKVKIHE